MILYKNDWKNYPTARPDWTTRNKSFVEIVLKFKAMGIENCFFPLALINQDLKGVDPHSKKLTEEQKLAIAVESKMNPWYFFREVARAPARGGFEGLPIEANRGNICLWWNFFNHITVYLTQPRQTGKSMSSDALHLYLTNVLLINTTVHIVTKDDKLRRENIERIRGMASLLPPYIYLKSSTDSENFEEITINRLNNKLKTHVPRAAAKDAYNVGRGMTTPILHFDESPFQKNIKVMMDAAVPATGAAIDIAKMQGTPWGIWHTFTAGKKDDPDGKYIYGLTQKAAFWSENYYDAVDETELAKMIRSNSPKGALSINAVFSHKQLGKSDAWLAEKLERIDTDGGSPDRDYFNVWTSGNETLPFSIELAEIIRNSQMDVRYTKIYKEGYAVRWYIDEDEITRYMSSHRFVLAMDPSENSGGDDTAFILIDITKLKVIAAANFNDTNTIMLSKWVANFLIEYSNVTAIIEKRSTGSAIIDNLLLLLPEAGEDPFKRLFNRVVNDADENPERYNEIRSVAFARRSIDFYTKFKSLFGFATSGSGLASRTSLYSATLRDALRYAGHGVSDIVTINQLLGLVIKNGRIDHPDGEHDDNVIAWLLCNWLLFSGKNLAYYGINTNEIYNPNRKKVEDMSYNEYFDHSQQQKLRNDITALYERLNNEKDQFISIKLEKQLRLLSSQLVLEEGEVFSVDQLINAVAENKKKTHQANRIRSMGVNDHYYNRPTQVVNGYVDSFSNGSVRGYSSWRT